eukprot:2235005-Amphidinium_carterae.1
MMHARVAEQIRDQLNWQSRRCDRFAKAAVLQLRQVSCVCMPSSLAIACAAGAHLQRSSQGAGGMSCREVALLTTSNGFKCKGRTIEL